MRSTSLKKMENTFSCEWEIRRRHLKREMNIIDLETMPGRV